MEPNDELPNMILNFNKLFTSKLNEPNNDVLDKVHVSVTMGMKEILLAPYTVEEVKKTLGLASEP